MELEIKKIIHLNDDSAFLSFCRSLLEKDGYEVQSFFGTPKALKYLAEMPRLPALIIIDGKMPDMDGPDFLKLLKEKLPNLFEHTVILGFSSYSKDSPIAKDFRALGAEFETKPDTIEEFLALIHFYLLKPVYV